MCLPISSRQLPDAILSTSVSVQLVLCATQLAGQGVVGAAACLFPHGVGPVKDAAWVLLYAAARQTCSRLTRVHRAARQRCDSSCLGSSRLQRLFGSR